MGDALKHEDKYKGPVFEAMPICIQYTDLCAAPVPLGVQASTPISKLRTARHDKEQIQNKVKRSLLKFGARF